MDLAGEEGNIVGRQPFTLPHEHTIDDINVYIRNSDTITTPTTTEFKVTITDAEETGYLQCGMVVASSSPTGTGGGLAKCDTTGVSTVQKTSLLPLSPNVLYGIEIVYISG